MKLLRGGLTPEMLVAIMQLRQEDIITLKQAQDLILYEK